MLSPVSLPDPLRQRQDLTQWPTPDADALAHSEHLQERLLEMMAQHGALSFAQYMEQVLYAPGLGYYSAGSRKLGAEGDFVTAPEISPLFSRCLARAITPVLAALPEAQILEVGAGSGTMALDIMRALPQLSCRYAILERSADLKQRQQQRVAQCLPARADRFSWLDALPEDFSGVVLANELLDALPVHRVIWLDGVWQELYVTVESEGFAWQVGPLSDARLSDRLQAIQQGMEVLVPGYVTEVNLAAEDWLRTLAAKLHRAVVVLIDYGYTRSSYYHPQRNSGTLMCHYRHRAHDDVFVYPGLQDITAHVDFTAVADVALASGMRVSGFTTQAQFLLASGLTTLAEECAAQQGNDAVSQLALANQIRRLTLPQEMGESFKVMMLEKQCDVPLAVSGMRDMRDSL